MKGILLSRIRWKACFWFAVSRPAAVAASTTDVSLGFASASDADLSRGRKGVPSLRTATAAMAYRSISSPRPIPATSIRAARASTGKRVIAVPSSVTPVMASIETPALRAARRDLTSICSAPSVSNVLMARATRPSGGGDTNGKFSVWVMPRPFSMRTTLVSARVSISGVSKSRKVLAKTALLYRR
eukprot:scaffold1087_cov198-Pinguiococcus_pyrenoidosus.AAC.31